MNLLSNPRMMARCSTKRARISSRFAVLFAVVLLPGVLLASQILEISSGSLTTYLAGRTSVQDARPRPEQRGVNLDGSLRSGSTFPMAIAGNPFEDAWHG